MAKTQDKTANKIVPKKDWSKMILFSLASLILIIAISLFAFKYVSTKEKNVDGTILKNAQLGISTPAQTDAVLEEKTLFASKQAGNVIIEAPQKEIKSIRTISPPNQPIHKDGKETRITTQILSVETQTDVPAEITLVKNGPVNTILYCPDFADDECAQWQESSIAFAQNETHISFNVPHFTAYAGGWVNQSIFVSSEDINYNWTRNISSMIKLKGYFWLNKLPLNPPAARWGHAMASDGDLMVLFGGEINGLYSGVHSAETWAYNFSSDVWINKTPANSPSERYNPAMAYINDSNLFLMYGGGHSGSLGDIWTYNFSSNTWTNMTPSSPPSARQNPAMAYDSDNGLVVMYGGWTTTYNSETWMYNLSSNTWTNMNPSSPPSARFSHAMAYDSDNKVFVMYGGNTGVNNAETWTYNLSSNTWTNMNPSSPPSARYKHAVVYDSDNGLVVMYGGWTTTYNSETWMYDLSSNTWTNKTPSNIPSARYGHTMTYDSDNKIFIMYGGYTGSLNNDTWITYALYSSNGTYTQTFDANQSVIWDKIYYDGIYGSELFADNSTVLLMHLNNDSSYGENDTQVYDWSGNDNNGTASSGAVWNSSGKIGGGFQFDGIDDYIEVPFTQGLNQTDVVTMEAWFKPSSYNENGWSGIVGRGNNYYLGYYVDNFSITFNNGGWMNHYYYAPFTPGNWYHVVATIDSTNDWMQMYLNGVMVLNETEITNMPEDESAAVTIGQNAAQYANGTIDEVAIYNRSLSDWEIKHHYEKGRQGRTDGDLTYQIAISDNNSSWSSFIGPDQTPSSYYSYSGQALNISNSRFLRYRFYLSTTNSSTTPTLSNITVKYYYPTMPNGSIKTETTRLVVWDDSETAQQYTNLQVKFYANYTNFTNGQSIAKEISNDSSTLLVMHFNNQSGYGENSTHIYDFSGKGNNGTVHGDAMWTSIGKMSGAYQFDGADDYINMSNLGLSGTIPFSLSLWVKATSHVALQELFSFGTDYNNGNLEIIKDYPSSGDLSLFTHNSVVLTTTFPSDEAWHNIIFISNTTDVFFYVDGEHAGSNPYALDVADVNYRIGASGPQPGNYFFNGTIDEVAIYNRSLSAEEVIKHYSENKAQHCIISENSSGSWSQITNMAFNWTSMLYETNLSLDYASTRAFNITCNASDLGFDVLSAIDSFNLSARDTCNPNGDNLFINTTVNCDSKTIKVPYLNITSTGRLVLNNVSLVAGKTEIKGIFEMHNSHNTIWQNGNLTISGVYILDNSTLRMNVSTDGEYGINVTGTMLVANGSNITNGEDTTKGYFFRVYPGANFTLKDSFVDAAGYGVAGGNYGTRGLWINTTTGAVLQNSTIYAGISQAMGLILLSSRNAVLNQSRINSSSSNGLYMDSSSDNIISDNIISSYSSRAIAILSSNRNNLSGNSISSYSQEGMFFSVSSNNVIDRNTIFSNDNRGLFLQSSSNSNLFSFNNISSATQSSTHLSAVSYNVFVGNNIQSPLGGLEVSLSTYNQFINNTLITSSAPGYSLSTSANNNLFIGNNVSSGSSYACNIFSSSNNTFTNNLFSSGSSNGVYAYASSENNTFTNNTISSDSGAGMFIKDSNSNRFYDGKVISNSSIGAHLYASNYSVFDGNTINSTSGHGLLVNKTRFSNFTDNLVFSNNSYGVYLLSSSNDRFNGNNISSNASFGVYLESSSSNKFLMNSMSSDKSCGSYLSASSYNEIVNGTIFSNINIGNYLNAAAYNNFSGNSILSRLSTANYLYSSSNNRYTNNTIFSVQGVGNMIYFGSHSNTFTGNVLASNSSGTGNSIDGSVTTNDNNQFFYNKISSYSAVANYQYAGWNSVFIGNNMSSSQVEGNRLMWVYGSTYTNNTISSLSSYALSLLNYDSSNSNNVFTGNLIISNSSEAIHFSASPKNWFISNTIISNFGVSVVFTTSSSNNTFIGCNISGRLADVNLTGGSFENYMINSTFNKSQMFSPSGSVKVSWYLDIHVNNTAGDDLENANVFVFNNTIGTSNTTITDVNGWTSSILLTEYMQNSTGIYPQTNYTINASKPTFIVSSQKLNLTRSYFLYVTLQSIAPVIIAEYPSNASFSNSKNSSLNFTVFDDTIDSCWFVNSTGDRIDILSCDNTTFMAREGYQNITIYANDTLNSIGSQQVFFTIDLIPPALIVRSPANASHHPSSNISLNLTASDGNLDACWFVNSTGSTFNLPSCDNATFIAIEGSQNITIYANDSANNINSSQIFFYIDTDYPALSVGMPENNSIHSQSTITLNYTAKDNFADKCWYLDATGGTLDIPNCQNTSFVLSDGDYNITVYFNDSVNRINSSQIFFTVDSITPAIQFVSPTPANDSIIAYAYSYINVSVSDLSQTSAFIDFNRSLVGYWNFELGFNDSSTYGNNLSCTDCPATTQGVRGGAQVFDGIDDYVFSAQNIPVSGAVNRSMGFWFKIRGEDSSALIGHYLAGITGGGASGDFLLAYDRAPRRIYFSANSNDLTGTALLSLNVWYHVMVTYDGSDVRLYLNGVFDGSKNVVLNTQSNPFSMAYPDWGDLINWKPFNGSIDEVQVWNRVLSQQEINASYNAGLFRLERNFTGLADGNYSYSASVIDAAGNINMAETRYLAIDMAKPAISFENPTPENNSLLNYAYSYINVSTSDSSQTSAFIDWNRSLVGYWTFGAGFNDSSTYGNNGSCNGVTCPVKAAGKFGDSMSFDGINDVIAVPHSSSLAATQNFAVEAWFNQRGRRNDSWQYGQAIVTKGRDNSGGSYRIIYDSSSYYFAFCIKFLESGLFGECAGSGYNAKNYSLNQWHHVVGTWNRTHLSIYLDGKLANSQNLGARTLPFNSDLLSIGMMTNWNYYFNGSIDEVRIWQRIFSESEINASYNAGIFRLERNFTDLADGNYSYSASVIDAAGNTNGTGTRYLSIDTMAPSITITSPQNNSFGPAATDITYVVGDLHVDSCWARNISGGIISLPGCANFTQVSSIDGYWNVTVYVNDTFGNMNLSTVFFSNDATLPNTTDNTSGSLEWITDSDAIVRLISVDNNFNFTKYCTYYAGGTPCTTFTQSDTNITDINVTCQSNSACEKIIRYFSADEAGNVEAVKESNKLQIIRGSTAANTNATLADIKGISNVSDSFLLNSTINGCTILNSTIINSTVSDTSASGACIIMDSTVQNGLVTDSTIIGSFTNNASRSVIEYSQTCEWSGVNLATISYNILLAGIMQHGNYTYYAPTNITVACAGVMPQAGTISANGTIVRNGSSVRFTYIGSTGSTVRVNASSLDSTASIIELIDPNSDGTYDASLVISPNNTKSDGMKQVLAEINDNLGNMRYAYLNMTLDNAAPTATFSINDGSSITSSRQVVLILNYSDENGIDSCRFANQISPTGVFGPCTPTKAWLLPDGFGIKTVFAEIKDNAGNTLLINDSISYAPTSQDSTPPVFDYVMDGMQSQDIDYMNSNTMLSAHWLATDYESYNIFYKYRLMQDGEPIGQEINHSLQSSLLGLYHFNGNASDASGNGRDGTIYGDLNCSAVGKMKNACSFNGADTNIDLAMPSSIFDSMNYSIELWFRSTQSADSITLVTTRNPSSFDNGFTLHFHQGRIQYYTAHDSGGAANLVYAESPDQYDDGRWHHVAVTTDRSAGNNSIYIDGAFKASATGDISYVFSGQNVEIGAMYGSTYNYDGMMDEVAFYNRKLSAAEIAAHYAQQYGEFIDLGQKSSLNLNNLELHENVNYSIEVSAYNINNSSLSSNASSDGFIVDIQNPNITALISTTHSFENIMYSNSTAVFEWNATDNNLLEGYSYLIDQNRYAEPDRIIETNESSVNFTSISPGTYYFHLKAIDAAGNHIVSHRKIIVGAGGYFINLQDLPEETSEACMPVNLTITDGLMAYVYRNGVYFDDWNFNGTTDVNLCFDEGLNVFIANATTPQGFIITSNIIHTTKITPQSANLSFTLSFNAVGEASTKMAYSNIGDYTFGLASDSGIASPVANPLSISANETGSAYVFMARPGAKLESKNALLEEGAFLDEPIPFFGADLDSQKYVVSAGLAYGDILFVGNTSLGMGRHALVITNQGTTDDGREIFTVRPR